jgi:hypothetical protein
MGNSIQKYTDDEWDLISEAPRSYTGLGTNWISSSTNKIYKNKEMIFRELLEEFKDWEDEWKYFKSNPNIKQPLNAEEYSKKLANRFNIEEL